MVSRPDCAERRSSKRTKSAFHDNDEQGRGDSTLKRPVKAQA
jgi:hypothetical protein